MGKKGIDGVVVYIMYNSYTKLTKIGVSNNVYSRKHSLEMASGVELELYYLSPALDNAYKIENILHVHYNTYRCHGEWFAIDKAKIKSKLISLRDKYKLSNIGELYISGLSISQIADKYGVTRQAIEKRLHGLGIIITRNKVKVTNNSIRIKSKPILKEDISVETNDKLTLQQMVDRNNKKLKDKYDLRKQEKKEIEERNR